jgi:hypothetical protein
LVPWKRTHAKATGRLVRKPNANEPMPAMAAVAVMRSLLIPAIINTLHDLIPGGLTEQAVVVV